MLNHSPFYLKLVPDETRICQLIFERLGETPTSGIATEFQVRILANVSGDSGDLSTGCEAVGV